MTKTICAWCPTFGRSAKFLDGDPVSREISHGMCDECRKEIVARERDRIERACVAAA